MKYFCFLPYRRLKNGVRMVTKLVLEIHALCNKNEISYVAKNVTLLIMDFPSSLINFKSLLYKQHAETNKNIRHLYIS